MARKNSKVAPGTQAVQVPAVSGREVPLLIIIIFPLTSRRTLGMKKFSVVRRTQQQKLGFYGFAKGVKCQEEKGKCHDVYKLHKKRLKCRR